MKSLIVFFLAAGLISAQSGGTRSEELYTVCEVLEHPDRFADRLITVRGIAVSTGEGTWLVGECATVSAKGHRWKNLIWLETAPHILEAEGFNPAALGRDLNKIRRDLMAAGPAVRKGTNWLTVVGRFKAVDDLMAGMSAKTGNNPAVGFGHQAEAPGELIVKSERGPVVQVP